MRAATQTPTNHSGAFQKPPSGTGQGRAIPRFETKKKSPTLTTFSISGAPIRRIVYTSTTCTSSGVLRKISTYSIAICATSQLGESRATPIATPSTVESAIATSTARSDDHTPTRYIVMREFVTPSTSVSHWLPTLNAAGSFRNPKPNSRRSSEV